MMSLCISSSATFGVMALYGSVTKTDLTKFGNIFLYLLRIFGRSDN